MDIGAQIRAAVQIQIAEALEEEVLETHDTLDDLNIPDDDWASEGLSLSEPMGRLFYLRHIWDTSDSYVNNVLAANAAE